MRIPINLESTKSQSPMKTAKMKTELKTTIVELINSSLVDQDTFLSSNLTSLKKLLIFLNIILNWQVRQDLNPQPPDLESDALAN